MSLLVLGEHRADLKKYGYRQADGSYNNVLYPSLRAAKMPYARTVKPAAAMAGVLPDPGVIFDSILKRKHYDNHPNGISSMLFYFASVIIHDLFRTDHRDFTISNTTSYLDLSPLYGSDQEEQDSMRTFKGGKIKPDSFSETRLLFFPPGVTCLLIMFNRWHNHVVEQLALINETLNSRSLPKVLQNGTNMSRNSLQSSMISLRGKEHSNHLIAIALTRRGLSTTMICFRPADSSRVACTSTASYMTMCVRF